MKLICDNKKNTDQIFWVCHGVLERRKLLVEELGEDDDDSETLVACSTEEKRLQVQNNINVNI